MLIWSGSDEIRGHFIKTTTHPAKQIDDESSRLGRNKQAVLYIISSLSIGVNPIPAA